MRQSEKSLSMLEAELLQGLASGKYDEEITFCLQKLNELAAIMPAAAPFIGAISVAIRGLLIVNKFTAGSGPLVSLPDGSVVYQSWIDNPRHALNPDGTFRE